MKKIITALLIVSIICTTSFTVTNAAPDTEASKAQLVEVSDKLKNLNAELNKTNSEIKDLESKISNNKASIEEHKKQIEAAQLKIDKLKDEIGENQKVLNTRIREMYKNNGFTAINYISYLFESTSLSDLIDRVSVCKTIIKEDTKLIDNLNNQVDDQNTTKELVSNKKQELESLNKETEDKLSEVTLKKASQEEVQKNLETEKNNLTETITKNELALINSYINTINNSSNYGEIKNAKSNIESIKPQFNMEKAISTANDAIAKADKRLSELSAASPSVAASSTFSSNDKVIATYTMQATAYTSSAKEPLTASGTKPVYNPSGISTIAVDPNVIPLGSKVKVEGYGYALALDTGSAIKGMIIDLYMNSEADCNRWGRRTVTVQVLG